MNPSYAYTNEPPKGPTGAPPQPHATSPPTANLGKKSTPPRLRRRGFTIGADDDESSGGEHGFAFGYINNGGGDGPKKGKSKEPVENTQVATGRKQRKRGRSLRKAALLRPGRPFDVVWGGGIPPVLGNGVPLAARRSGSPSSLILPSPVLAAPMPVGSAGSAVYDSVDEEEEEEGGSAYRGGGGVSRYGRGRSGSIVMVMPRTRQEEITSAADTAYWGWVVGGATWVVFVVGMGSVLGVWEWAWDVPGSPFPMLPEVHNKGDEGAFPIPGYYPALIILTCIMAWVWVVVAWVGMKYFKHAKIQPPSDDLL